MSRIGAGIVHGGELTPVEHLPLAPER